MTISDSQKVDYLWKKLGYGATKTDTNANKKAPNEAIASPLLLRADKVLQQASSIPATIPSSSSGVVTVYLGSNAIETTEDTTASSDRTWKTGQTDWIPPEFGSTYLVKVYADTTGAADPTSTGTQLFATGSGNNDEWFFDYQSGVLHFIGTNLPSEVDGTNVIYIVGARYTGTFGVGSGGTEVTLNISQTLTANNIVANNTITVGDISINTSTVTSDVLSANTLQLFNALETQYGGTGLDSLTQDGILFAKSNSAFEFSTGSSGEILQIAANGTPAFDSLDGGTF